MNILYYDDKYLKEVNTTLLESLESDGSFFIRVEDNLFYPQGGGQKGDRGKILIDDQTYSVINTVKDHTEQFGILIQVDREIPNSFCGNSIQCILDWGFRNAQMRLHTSQHMQHCLLGKVVGSAIDNPTVAAIDIGFAFNKYPLGLYDQTTIDETIALFYSTIKNHEKVVTYPDPEKEGFRWWECMDFKMPCGGLHVDYLDEIGNVEITTTSKKKALTFKIILNNE